MDIEKMVFDVKEGNTCPLTTYAELKNLADNIKTAMDSIKPECLNELERHLAGTREKTAKVGGVTFGKTQSGRYSYSHFVDYVNQQQRVKDIEEKMKVAFQLKSDYIDPETGEVYPMAEYTPSEISISVKFKK